MKVAYSVATQFGGSGIGTTSYHAVKGVYDHQNLDKVYCSSYRLRDIPQSYIKSTNSSFIENIRLVPSVYQWFLKDNYHDLLVSFQAHPVDIFHGWNGHSLLSLRKFKRKGAKIVIERASSHPTTQVEILSKEFRKRGLNSYQMLSLNMKKLLQEFRECDYITVPSPFSYQSMVENNVPTEKLIQLPFGVDTKGFKPGQKSGGRFEVLFVGQVGFRKGIPYLLEAWKELQLKDAHLTIVGQIDPTIVEFLTRFRQDPSITFAGFTPTLPLYQQADVFVFPSLEEGSALVTYEALACGLPVITTQASGSVVVDGDEGFIIPAGDSRFIGEKIQTLYDKTELRQKMSLAARHKAQQYTWESYGERLVSAYKKINSQVSSQNP